MLVAAALSVVGGRGRPPVSPSLTLSLSFVSQLFLAPSSLPPSMHVHAACARIDGSMRDASTRTVGAADTHCFIARRWSVLCRSRWWSAWSLGCDEDSHGSDTRGRPSSAKIWRSGGGLAKKLARCLHPMASSERLHEHTTPSPCACSFKAIRKHTRPARATMPRTHCAVAGPSCSAPVRKGRRGGV